MKIIPSFRYQLRDHVPTIIVFYGVLLGMLLLSLVGLLFFPDGSITMTNGVTACTAITLFVVGLCTFKDHFLMMMQHGVSRRSLFLSRLCAMAAVCGAAAVFDELYTLLCIALHQAWPAAFSACSLYEAIFCGGQTAAATLLPSILFSFLLLMATNSFGYLITNLNYRLNKTGKIIFWVSWPLLIPIGSAFLDRNPALCDAFVAGLLRFFAFTCGTPLRFCLSALVLTAVFSGLSWLLIRRASVK